MRKKTEPEKKSPEFRPEKPAQQFEQPSAKPSFNPKPKTFEELLREITEGKQQAESEVVDYDDQIGEEEQDLEEIRSDYRKDDKIYEVYEEAKRMAFARPSLEETMKLEDTKVQYGKFKEFEIEQKRDLLSEYLTDFRDPEGFKKAVVMSEILQRKF
ncbi:MAG TPA: hypothetical protein VGK59_17685 [Ohtaekwangia sp.]